MPIDRMALVQLSDLDAGTPAALGTGTRVLPGEGDLPLEDHIRAAHEAGYAGAYEIELLGQAEPDRTAIRRSLELVSAMLDRVAGR